MFLSSEHVCLFRDEVTPLVDLLIFSQKLPVFSAPTTQLCKTSPHNEPCLTQILAPLFTAGNKLHVLALILGE